MLIKYARKDRKLPLIEKILKVCDQGCHMYQEGDTKMYFNIHKDKKIVHIPRYTYVYGGPKWTEYYVPFSALPYEALLHIYAVFKDGAQ